MSSIVVSESITEKLLQEIKPIIQQGKLKQIQMIWSIYSDANMGKRVKWTIIFQQALLYAANQKQHDIYDWIESLHSTFNEAEKREVKKAYAYSQFVRHHVVGK